MLRNEESSFRRGNFWFGQACGALGSEGSFWPTYIVFLIKVLSTTDLRLITKSNLLHRWLCSDLLGCFILLVETVGLERVLELLRFTWACLTYNYTAIRLVVFTFAGGRFMNRLPFLICNYSAVPSFKWILMSRREGSVACKTVYSSAPIWDQVWLISLLTSNPDFYHKVLTSR